MARMQGNAALDAWTTHSALAAARAHRIAASVRAARARAERALSLDDCAVFNAAQTHIDLITDPFAPAQPPCAANIALRARVKHRATRDKLRKRRQVARDRLQRTEAATKAKALAHAQKQAEARAEAEKQEAQAAERRKAAIEAEQRANVAAEAAAKAAAHAAPTPLPEATPKSPDPEVAPVLPPSAPSSQAATDQVTVVDAAPVRDDGALPEDVQNVRNDFVQLVQAGAAFGGSKDGATKRARLNLKKAINRAANQVAASQHQVSRCVASISAALRNAYAQSGGAYAWAVVEMSRRLISDASSAERGAAQFALAKVALGAIECAPDVKFAAVAMRGALLETCIYIAPCFPRKNRQETDKHFRARIGASDKEGPERYSRRMAALVGLYAALIASSGPNNPAFSAGDGWTWLARVVNAKRQHHIIPDIVVSFLEAAGHDLSVKYRRQFAKLMATVQARCVRKASKSAPPGPKANLENMINNFIAAGCSFSEPPEGKVLPVSDAVNE